MLESIPTTYLMKSRRDICCEELEIPRNPPQLILKTTDVLLISALDS
jgi:hypothetical protein